MGREELSTLFPAPLIARRHNGFRRSTCLRSWWSPPGMIGSEGNRWGERRCSDLAPGTPTLEVEMRNKTTPPRRERVERGIWRHPVTRRYEFNYTDSSGKLRWKTVEGGLREARAARASVVAKLHRGERVVPTSQTFEELAREWLASAHLRARTRATYETSLREHA